MSSILKLLKKIGKTRTNFLYGWYVDYNPEMEKDVWGVRNNNRHYPTDNHLDYYWDQGMINAEILNEATPYSSVEDREDASHNNLGYYLVTIGVITKLERDTEADDIFFNFPTRERALEVAKNLEYWETGHKFRIIQSLITNPSIDNFDFE